MNAKLDPAKEIGREISNRRKGALLSQKQLAAELGMTAAQLCKIEKGTSIPRAETLARIDRRLGINVCSLVALREHLIAEAAHDYPDDLPPAERLLCASRVSATEDEIAALVAEAIPRLDEYAALEKQLNLPRFCRLWPVDEEGTTAAADGIRMAESLRFYLDLGNAPLRALIPLVERWNVRILFFPDLPPIRDNGRMKRRAVLGFYDACYDTPVLCVNDQCSPDEQIYNLAYESACCLRFRRERRINRHWAEPEWIFARAFAATLLVPTAALVDFVNALALGTTNWTHELATYVARVFGVSREALVWRLCSLGLIGESTSRRLMKPADGRSPAVPSGLSAPPEPAAPLPRDMWLNLLRSRAGRKTKRA